MKNKLGKIITIVIVIIGLTVLTFFAVDFYGYFKEKNQTKNQQVEQEKLEQADQLRQMRDKIAELENKPETVPVIPKNETKIIYRTIVPPEIKKENSIADIVAEWKGRVAEVTCEWRYDTGVLYEIASGSATLVNVTDIGIVAVTNKHVIVNNGYVPDRCFVGVYKTGMRVASYGINVFQEDKYGRDWGSINLVNAIQDPVGVFSNIGEINSCEENNVNIGDKLVILGYPSIGTMGGITATEGMVSGIEQDYYVTDAKIEHGNSGGAAILVKDDCWLGIPSTSVTGSLESLGRILKGSLIF